MIAKQPENRYANWAELAMEIAEIGRFSASQQPISDSEKYTMLREKNELLAFSDPDIWEIVLASNWTRIPARTIIMTEDEPA